MNKAFEMILDRLNDAGACDAICEYGNGWNNAIDEAILIVQEVAEEYKNELDMSERRNRIVPPSIPDNNKRSYCMICGENVNENYNYCKKCGVKLKECDNVWMI